LNTYIFSPGNQPVASIEGSDQVFPINRIYCVGQNYAEHAREMGADPGREPPCFFSKPADAVVRAPNSQAEARAIPYPPRSQDLHHEIELVIAIGRGGSNISAGHAEIHVFGFAVGLDLTRRDLQKQAKDQGRPWDTAKGFDHSAPISAIHTIESAGWPRRGRIWLKVNGELRQDADVEDMIWNMNEIIAELSTYYELKPGDLIFTGTPAGVSAVQRGDLLEGGVEGVDSLCVRIE
jgi:fumarylpyruvate hydrolase